jgi:hypothetical protein
MQFLKFVSAAIIASATLAVTATNASALTQSRSVDVVNGAGTGSLVYDGANLTMVARIITTSCFMPAINSPGLIAPTVFKPTFGQIQANFDIQLVHNMASNPETCAFNPLVHIVTGRSKINYKGFYNTQIVVKAPRTARINPYANVQFLDMTNISSIERNSQRFSLKKDQGTKCINGILSCSFVEIAEFGQSAKSYVTTAQTLIQKLCYLDSYESAAFYFKALKPTTGTVLVGHNGTNWVIKANVFSTNKLSSYEVWEINPRTFEMTKKF